MHLQEIISFLVFRDELEVARTLLNTFEKYSNSLQHYDELGMLYEKAKDYEKSYEMLNKALPLSNASQLYGIRANMAKILNHMNRPHKSLEFSTYNLQTNPEDLNTVMEISFSHYLMGDKEKSYQIQSDLLTKDIDDDIKERIMYNMGTFMMERGKFKEGIRNMILGGRGLGIWPPVKRPYPKWDGEDTTKTLVIYGEAGIGDEIINVRFMNYLKKRNINAIWVGLRSDLCEVFNYSGIKAIHSSVRLDPMEEYVYLEAMSLPIYLELDETQLWNGPYLKPKDQYIEKWSKILPKDFITLRWKGNPYYDQDLHRFIDKDIMVDKFSKLDIPMVSLQIDFKNQDQRLIDVDVETWEDTFAIQHLAKYNITSCTSTAHSAASMDVKTIILPPIATYYPWLTMRDKTHSYWYGENTNLFFQTKHLNWDDSVGQAYDFILKDIK